MFDNLWYCIEGSPSLDTDSDTPAIQMFLYSLCDKNIFSERVALCRRSKSALQHTKSVFLGVSVDLRGGEPGHSPSSSAEGNNECSYIATHHKGLHGVCKNNSTFYFNQ